MSKVVVIAEAGVNHNGSLEEAKKLALCAKNAGVDYIKYQTFIASELVCENAKKADYQNNNDKSSKTQLEMLEKLNLTFDEFIELRKYCKEIDIKFMTTAFDLKSLDFIVNELKVDTLKIPSGEITNYPYLVACAKTGLPIIMSTGMCDLNEISESVNVLKENGCKELSLLHCTTEYPAPLESVNLLAMQTLKKEFGVNVGYSDHTKGVDVPCYAVAMGATVIEKHFTTDKNLPGPDHKASLEPNELKEMVDKIREIEIILGDGSKKPQDAESKNKAVARKSIVAKCDIKAGEIFTENNLTCKRPGDGISPMKWNMVIGQIAKKDFYKDEKIEL